MNRLRRFFPALLIATPLLAFAAFSSANGGLLAIANAGYGGQYTPTITPSIETVSPGQHVDFGGRGFGIEENVAITLDGVPAGNAHADGGGNFSTGSITTPTTPGTYTYTFTGSTSNTPVTATITVSDQGTSGTGTGGGTTGGGSNGTPSVSSDQTVQAGASFDIGGRNFGHEETVTVTLNGATVTTAHADGGGNFSTGSVAVPTTPGTYTYTLTGATSGIVQNDTITVTQ